MPVDLHSPVSKILEPKVAKTFELTGRHVLISLILFFGVIATVNFTMMNLAIRTMPGSEVKSSYEASQQFNRRLDTIAEQDRRGWQVDIATGNIHPGSPLDVHVRNREGEAIGGLTITALIERPATARDDRRLALADLGAGRYAAVMPTIAPGQWVVTVEIRRDEEKLFVSQRRILIKG
jgi:nitrogen fixation protein FixH